MQAVQPAAAAAAAAENAAENDPENDAPVGRPVRAARRAVSYREDSIGSKMRQGDAHTFGEVPTHWPRSEKPWYERRRRYGDAAPLRDVNAGGGAGSAPAARKRSRRARRRDPFPLVVASGGEGPLQLVPLASASNELPEGHVDDYDYDSAQRDVDDYDYGSDFGGLDHGARGGGEGSDYGGFDDEGVDGDDDSYSAGSCGPRAVGGGDDSGSDGSSGPSAARAVSLLPRTPHFNSIARAFRGDGSGGDGGGGGGDGGSDDEGEGSEPNVLPELVPQPGSGHGRIRDACARILHGLAADPALGPRSP
jgi:hypothetical protein